MHRTKITSFLCVLILIISISGCTGTTGKSKSDNMVNDTNLSNISTFSGKIQIYKIKRNCFLSFLEKQSLAVLKNAETKSFLYPKDGEWYVTHNVNRFKIQQKMIDFIGSRIAIENYLTEHGITGEVEDLIVFEAPNVPITIWIKTSSTNVFVTINEQSEDEPYVYRLYSQIDYIQKYNIKIAQLIVNGKTVESKKGAKLYYNYADIPLITVIKEMGAEVIWTSDTEATIIFNGEKYLIDTSTLSLCKYDVRNENFLYKVDGSPSFVYLESKEVFLDSTTLNFVLREMGEKVRVECDNKNLIVTITSLNT